MEILFSKTGSKGNCSVLKSSSGKLLCIDCGIQYNKVNKGTGYILHECGSLLITHAHNDRTGFLSDFKKMGMNLYCGEETALKSDLNGFCECLKNMKQFGVDGFKVIPLAMKHTNSDGSECECYGFLIQDTSSKEKLLWCTDTQFIEYRFPPLDFYCIEANFWEQEEYLDDLDVIEKTVEMRRVRSHMSVQTATDFLKKQDLSKCKEIRLLHISGSMTKAEQERIIPYIQEQIGRKDINVVL